MATRVNVEGYTYDQRNTDLELTKYTGTDLNITTPIIERYGLVTITIEANVSNAKVVFEIDGQSIESNSISVVVGTEVKYTVSAKSYETVSVTMIASDDETIHVDLVPLSYTLTINPTPADATITLEAAGYTQFLNHITVPYGTEVLYTVSKLAYSTVRGLIPVTSNINLDVHLVKAGNAAKFMNYGTCVVCFQLSGTRTFDLGETKQTPKEKYDYGTNLETGHFDEFIDCGGLDG